MIGSRSRRVAAQRGISSIVVVSLVFVTVVLAFVAVLLYAEAAEKERIVVALDRKKKDLNAEQSRIKRARDASIAPTGFTTEAAVPTAEGETPAPSGDLPIKAVRDYLADRRQKLLEKPQQRDESADPALQEYDKKYADLARNATGEKAFNTLEELIGLAAGRVLQGMILVKQRQQDVELAEDRKAAIAENKGRLPAKAAEYNTELEDRLRRVTEAKNKIDTECKEDVGKLDAKIAELEQRITTLKQDYVRENVRFSNAINKRKGELEDLKVKEVIRYEISEAHGKLLSPDVPNRVAFIDLGSRERIVPGLKFLVAKKGNQGKFQYKGKVLVKKVWMTYAEVAITDIYDRNQPLVDGDLLVNPLYSARRPVVVYFLGEREPRRLRPNWSVAEATRRIREVGGEVREGLTLDVDFVIFTETRANTTRDQDEGYKLAVLLGIPVEEASELYRFLED